MSGYVYTSARERDIFKVIPDLIKARELLRDLVWKELRARYRYAMMGFLWAILEPLLFTLILGFVFAILLADKASFASGGSSQPFIVMLLCGLIFWQFTSTALTSATFSLIANQNLVKKVHFARETVPLASVCVPLVNLAIGFVLLLVMHLIFHGRITAALIWIPAVFLIQFALTAGVALIFSCGHIIYRDVGNMVNVGLLFGFYASPVFYPLEMVQNAHLLPNWVVYLYMMNPMAGLLTAYRHILFGGHFPPITLLLWPALLALILLAAGLIIFRRNAPTFSDYL